MSIIHHTYTPRDALGDDTPPLSGRPGYQIIRTVKCIMLTVLLVIDPELSGKRVRTSGAIKYPREEKP